MGGDFRKGGGVEMDRRSMVANEGRGPRNKQGYLQIKDLIEFKRAF